VKITQKFENRIRNLSKNRLRIKKFVCAMYKTEHLKAAIAGHVCIHWDIKLDL